ncbi:MAG: T9SS type A sorting domain-containing protein [Bacteroidetes bacterium]|nr:T9SS type A sorting domain-containing protein [Bacteroidota bacterium]
MNRIIIIIFCFIYFHCTAQDTIKVLFIGNSFTYFENMPDLFRNIADSAGYKVKTQMYAPGGVSVGDTAQGTMAHMNNPLVYDNIRSDKWDYVVLQDNQGRFVLDYGKFSSSSLVIQGHFKIRDSVIHNNPCAKMIWFSGWGMKNGLPPYGNTGSEMIERITANYHFLNDTARQVIAPIGAAWEKIIQINPGYDLWSADETHPSLEGAYLTANVIYATIFRDDPMYSSANGGLSVSTNNLLKQIAWQTVSDSIAVTNLSSITPYLQLQNNQLTAGNYQHYFWYNNMQFISTATSNVLNISQSGHYYLMAENAMGCKLKSMSKHIIITNITNNTLQSYFNLYPNPAKSTINIDFTKENAFPLRINIFNINAQLVKNIKINDTVNTTIDVSDLEKGLYLIEMIGNKGILEIKKLLIE